MNDKFSTSGCEHDLPQAPVELRCEYIKEPLGIDTLQPRFSWQMVNHGRGQLQTAYQVLVSSSLENLKCQVGDQWDSGKVESSQSTHVVYEGAPLISGRTYYWMVRCWMGSSHPTPFSKESFFQMGMLDHRDWKGQWIGAPKFISSPLFRKVFAIRGHVREAKVYICGLGYYQLNLNGRKVGDHVLDPNWTNFDHRDMKDLLYPFEDRSRKRVLYVTYDVTDHLKQGSDNVIGVMLGNGWYNQRERIVEGKLWYGLPKLLAELHIQYDDGTQERIVTDSSWECCPGPIKFNNIFYGEIYDARLEKKNWDKVGELEDGWEAAVPVQPPEGALVSQMSPPDKVMRCIRPVKVSYPAPNTAVYDMGQNFSGWAAVKVRGSRGTRLILRYAEEIHENGQLDFESAGGEDQIQKDEYILKGDGLESYEPRFTWHGFRYVEITSCSETLTLVDVEGRFVHSAVERAGEFSCSNPLLNRKI
jgi:alpha-L-rhamnosidase